MTGTKILVHGALGKMGQAVIKTVYYHPEFSLVGAVDAKADREQLDLPDRSGVIPLSRNLETILSTVHPDVMVDFTQHDATMPAARLAVKHGINLVVGTTGISQDELEEIDRLARENTVGAIVASNFSLGAVMMMHLAKIAGKFFDYAEIIEMHHEQKLDSPSGTSLATARGMIQAREGKAFTYPVTEKESIKGGRGAQFEGIAVHSVRSPGYMAHQEVILGSPGETLKIRHDQISRDAFGPGIALAIKEVVKSKGLTFGLDRILELQE